MCSSDLRRILKVKVINGHLDPGASFTINLKKLALRPDALGSNAEEHAFGCVIGDPDGADPEPDSGITYTVVPVSGGKLLPLPVNHIYAIAPSRVQVDEEFSLRLSVQDEYDNLTPDTVGTLLLSCTDPAAVFASQTALAAGDEGTKELSVTLKTPGIQRFTVSLAGFSATTSTSNVIDVRSATPDRILWGDYHNHSSRCDGTGEPEELVRYASGVAFLDWYCLTSHDAPPWYLAGTMRWNDIKDVIDSNQSSIFITIPGYEWTKDFDDDGNAGDGHRNVMTTSWDSLLPVLRSNDSNYDHSSELYRGMMARTSEFIIVPHHLNSYKWWHLPASGSAAAIPDAERDRYMPMIEVYSQLHGNYEAPASFSAWSVPPAWRAPTDWRTNPDQPCYVVGGLARGAVAGLMAGGDNHSARPGSHVYGAFTAVLTDDFSRAGIIEAFRRRHTYATSGHRPIMEFSSGDAIMGDIVRFSPGASAPVFSYRVAAPLEITGLRVVRVTFGAWSDLEIAVPSGFTEFSGTFTDQDFDPSWSFADYYLVAEYKNNRSHYVYPETGDDANDRAWTSPIFFFPDERLIIASGDYDGDGTSDLAVFRGSSGLWAVRGITRVYFGSADDLPVPGDYNGDRRADIGIFRGSSGLWAVRGITRAYFGSSSDGAVPGDYDGDGSCDFGIFRPSSGLWAIRGVTRAYFGAPGDGAVPGNYSGAPSSEIGIFRGSSGLWAIRGVSRVYFGAASDLPVPGNYDGGGWDIGIFRPASGLWAIRNVTRIYFGSSSDNPVPADFSGTGEIGRAHV